MKILLQLILILLLTIPQLVFSQSQPKEIDLGVISISSHYYPQSEAKLGQSVTVITEKEIAKRGKTNFFDLLRSISGVDLSPLGAPGEDFNLSIRGSDFDEVLVMIDGVAINDLIQARPLSLNAIPVNFIDKIEVVRGAVSTVYGANAVGGIVNVITKKGKDEKELGLSLQGGNLRTFQESLWAAGQFNRHKLAFSYTRADSGGRFANDRFAGDSLFLNYSYDFSEKLSFKNNFFYIHYDQEYAFDPSVFDLSNFPSSADVYIWRDNNRRISRNLIMTQAKLEWQVLKNLNSQLIYSLYLEDQVLKNSNQNDINPPNAAGLSSQLFSSLGHRHNFEWRNRLALLEKDEDQIHFNFGVQGQLEYLRTSNESLPGDSPVIAKTEFPDSSLGQKALRRNLAGYLEGEFLYHDRFFLSLGLRYDDNETYGGASSFRISSSLRFPKTDSKLFFNFANAFKAPTINQYYISLSDGTGFQLSQRVDKEKSFVVEVGLEQKWQDDLTLRSSYFYNQYDDLIDGLELVSNAHIHGLEVNLTWRAWQDRLTWKNNYTLLLSEKNSSGQKLSNRPTHQFSSVLDVEIYQNLNIGLDFQFVSQRRVPTVLSTEAFGDINLVYFDDKSNPLGTDLASYYLLGMSVQYDQLISKKWLKKIHYSLNLTNILNKNYQLSAGFPQPRFTFLAGLEFHFL